MNIKHFVIAGTMSFVAYQAYAADCGGAAAAASAAGSDLGSAVVGAASSGNFSQMNDLLAGAAQNGGDIGGLIQAAASAAPSALAGAVQAITACAGEESDAAIDALATAIDALEEIAQAEGVTAEAKAQVQKIVKQITDENAVLVQTLVQRNMAFEPAAGPAEVPAEEADPQPAFVPQIPAAPTENPASVSPN